MNTTCPPGIDSTPLSERGRKKKPTPIMPPPAEPTSLAAGLSTQEATPPSSEESLRGTSEANPHGVKRKKPRRRGEPLGQEFRARSPDGEVRGGQSTDTSLTSRRMMKRRPSLLRDFQDREDFRIMVYPLWRKLRSLKR